MRLHAAVIWAVACAAASVVPIQRADAETSRADENPPSKQGVKQKA